MILKDPAMNTLTTAYVAGGRHQAARRMGRGAVHSILPHSPRGFAARYLPPAPTIPPATQATITTVLLEDKVITGFL